MDEATASLDAETAFAVTSSILDIEQLTRIIVTHRLEEKLLTRYDEIIGHARRHDLRARYVCGADGTAGVFLLTLYGFQTDEAEERKRTCQGRHTFC